MNEETGHTNLMMTPKGCSNPKAVYLTMVLLLAGCSGGAEPDEPGPTAVAEPTAVPDAAPPPAPSTPPPPPESTTAAASPPPVSSDALAVEEHDVGGVEVTLTQVRRGSGDTLNVRWRY